MKDEGGRMKIMAQSTLRLHLSSRRFGFALCAFLFLLLSSTPSRAATWKKFAPPGGQFSVLLPGVPKGERKINKDKDGTQTIDQDYTLETADRLYMIGYQEHDAEVAKFINVAALLDEMVKTVAREASGKLKSRRTLRVNGFDGREVVAAIEGGGTLRFRVFWTGRRLYTALAAFPKRAGANADALRFLQSLSLAKNR